MTPEQRIKRVERVMLRLIRAGRRARHEWGQKVNILLDAQIATEDAIRRAGEEIRNLAVGQVRLENEMVELARSQKLTDRALRAFINSQRKSRNGPSN
jgi:hypothetical protein